MQALQIKDIKQFMQALLASDSFDSMLLSEAKIRGKASFVIEGQAAAEYFTPEEEESLGISGLAYLPYGLLRQNCFDLIKGKKIPSEFCFVLLAPPEEIRDLIAEHGLDFQPEDVGNMTLTLRFAEGRLTALSTVTLKTFSMDRSLEKAWDSSVIQRLERLKIGWEMQA